MDSEGSATVSSLLVCRPLTDRFSLGRYEIPKCIMVFTKEKLYVLSSAKKVCLIHRPQLHNYAVTVLFLQTKYISECVAAITDSPPEVP